MYVNLIFFIGIPTIGMHHTGSSKILINDDNTEAKLFKLG